MTSFGIPENTWKKGGGVEPPCWHDVVLRRKDKIKLAQRDKEDTMPEALINCSLLWNVCKAKKRPIFFIALIVTYMYGNDFKRGNYRSGF